MQLFKEKGNYSTSFGEEDAKDRWREKYVVYFFFVEIPLFLPPVNHDRDAANNPPRLAAPTPTTPTKEPVVSESPPKSTPVQPAATTPSPEQGTTTQGSNSDVGLETPKESPRGDSPRATATTPTSGRKLSVGEIKAQMEEKAVTPSFSSSSYFLFYYTLSYKKCSESLLTQSLWFSRGVETVGIA